MNERVESMGLPDYPTKNKVYHQLLEAVREAIDVSASAALSAIPAGRVADLDLTSLHEAVKRKVEGKLIYGEKPKEGS